MARFRKKSVEIEAVRYIGDGNIENSDVPDWMLAALRLGTITNTVTEEMKIATLEGIMTVAPGDWIIRGIHGELYPVKPDIFAETYEPVEPSSKAGETR